MEKDKYRQSVLEKIEEYEKNGWFDKDADSKVQAQKWLRDWKKDDGRNYFYRGFICLPLSA